jgi:predicted RNA-binding protein with PIN domain
MLTPKQEKFAQLVVSLGNQSEAYRQAYDLSNNDAEWIASKASVLCSEVNIRQRIKEIKEESKKAHGLDRDKIIKYHLNMIEAWEELWSLGKRNDLEKDEKQRFYLLKELVKGSDYRGSLAEISKLTGMYEPDKVEIKDTSHTSNWGS